MIFIWRDKYLKNIIQRLNDICEKISNKEKNLMIKLFENYLVYSPLWWNYSSLYTLNDKREYKILFKKKYRLNWKAENHRNHRKRNYAFIQRKLFQPTY